MFAIGAGSWLDRCRVTEEEHCNPDLCVIGKGAEITWWTFRGPLSYVLISALVPCWLETDI